jgi:cytochrome c oxidase assembly protein subunit 15
MDGRLVPEGYFGTNARLTDLFETVEAVQFNHRMMAFAVVAVAALFVVRAIQAGRGREAALVGGSVGLQFLLGITALVTAVPLWLGLAHQAGALLVLAAGVYALYGLSAPAAEGVRGFRPLALQTRS